MKPLKSPCKECPFLLGSSLRETLREGRIDGIKKGLIESDDHFPCHKTLDTDRKECAGARAFQFKHNRLSIHARLLVAFKKITIKEIEEIYPLVDLELIE